MKLQDLEFSKKIFVEGGGPLLICHSKEAEHWRGEFGTELHPQPRYVLRCEGGEKIFDEIYKRQPGFSFQQTFEDLNSLEAALIEIEKCILSVAPGAVNVLPAPEPAQSGDYERLYKVGSNPVFKCQIQTETDFFRAHSCLNEADIALLPLQSEGSEQGRGIVWFINGAGTIEIGANSSRECVVFLKIFKNPNIDRSEIYDYVSGNFGQKSDLTFDVLPSEKLIAFWSPLDGAQISQSSKTDNYISWPDLPQAGMEFELPAGSYHLFSGDHRSDGWSAHWLALKKS